MIKRVLIRSLVMAVAVLIAGFCIERFIAYQRWTLAGDGQWYSSKDHGGYKMGLMGGIDFMLNRQALAGGALHLAEWNGFNELTYKKPLQWRNIRVDFRLAPGAYLWVFFDHATDDRVGVRLSRDPDKPSGLYRMTSRRQLILKVPLPTMRSGEQTLKIAMPPGGQENTSEDFTINSDFNFRYRRYSPSSYLTLRSGYKDATVYRVQVEGPESNLDEGFAPPWSTSTGLIAAGAILAISLGLWWFSSLQLASSAVLLGLFAAVLATGLRVGDRYFYAPFYFKKPIRFEHFSNRATLPRIEQFRRRVFHMPSGARAMPMEMAGSLHMDPTKDPALFRNLQWIEPDGEVNYFTSIDQLSRIPSITNFFVIFGTSQSWGAGASSPSATWFSQLVRKINENAPTPVVALNISVCGSDIRQLTPILQDVFAKTSPRAILINLGNNDSSHASLDSMPDNFRKIVAMAKDRHANILISLEPRNYEVDKDNHYLPAHRALVKFSKQFHLPLADAFTYMRRPEIRHSGFLFWDIVHLDDWGQYLLSDFIYRSFDWNKAMGFKMEHPKHRKK